ncbi:phage tail sheath family protein [Cohnella sp. GCM10012308]|uniref:phage tail sheath family protein n=1 Tax=Cohnella sp. GCM10012308 TaxID=3317329 RepID=UPI00360ED7D6
MAGGTYTVMNKVRPGVYINFVSEGSAATLGDRGTAAIGLTLPWGASKTIVTLEAGEDPSTKLGYDITGSPLLLVREALKRAKTLLVFRLNTGTKATVTSGNLTATARYGGVRGNDLSIAIAVNVDDNSKYDVSTLLSGTVVNKQTVASIAGLVSNNWIDWSGTGALAASAGAPLTGGADGTVVNGDHTDFLNAVELQDFQTVAYAGTDSTLKGVYAAFARRLRDDEGRKIQVVVENYPSADFEGVISVKNGVKLDDGTTLTAGQATAWVAGATAAAAANLSLTYTAYDGAVDAGTRFTNAQTIAALQNGELVFTARAGGVVVEQDINSFHSFSPTKSRLFAKNRTLRVLDGLANDWKNTFEAAYIGKVGNDDAGRALFRKDCVKIVTAYQGIGAIQNFDPLTDISVVQGDDADSVVVTAAIQPVDAIEKIYMKVQVR